MNELCEKLIEVDYEIKLNRSLSFQKKRGFGKLTKSYIMASGKIRSKICCVGPSDFLTASENKYFA